MLSYRPTRTFPSALHNSSEYSNVEKWQVSIDGRETALCQPHLGMLMEFTSSLCVCVCVCVCAIVVSVYLHVHV